MTRETVKKATPHSANITKELQLKFKWDIWEHLPYRPYLSPCDFHKLAKE